MQKQNNQALVWVPQPCIFKLIVFLTNQCNFLKNKAQDLEKADGGDHGEGWGREYSALGQEVTSVSSFIFQVASIFHVYDVKFYL